MGAAPCQDSLKGGQHVQPEFPAENSEQRVVAAPAPGPPHAVPEQLGAPSAGHLVVST